MDHLTPIAALPVADARAIEGIFCDIDDTLTVHGRLVPEAFLALQRAMDAGLKVVPVTGRPAGWVDHIARCWPVDAVVGENGGLWFYVSDGRMHRRFAQSAEVRRTNQLKLRELSGVILRAVPGTALASDQGYRELDLAIDFCEDVPRLSDEAIDAIVACFEDAGATCKVSSIHVNGWYGDFDKLSGCEALLAERFDADPAEARSRWMYVGDSANDEPMFAAFAVSVGVANVRDFLPRMKAWPTYVTRGHGGHGFAEAMDVLLGLRAS